MNDLPHRYEPDFKTLYNSVPCGLLTFNLSGNIIYANETLLRWLGLTNEEITVKKFTDFLDKGGLLYYQVFVYPLLNINSEAKEISFQIHNRKCSFPCLFSAYTISLGKDEEKVVQASIFKMVDRKKYEDELLNKKIQAEKQKIKILEKVIFTQSHLVRAPLANLLGLVALLEGMQLKKDIEAIADMLKTSALQLDTEIKNGITKINNILLGTDE